MVTSKENTGGEKKIAVVTGANRGIGFETARELAGKGYTVLLTSRSEAKGKAAAETLKKEGLDVTFHQLDVTDDASVARFKTDVEKKYGRVDVLVNNAGVMLDRGDGGFSSALTADIEVIRKTLETNTYGALRMIQALVPLMKKHGYGRIVNLSSGMGQLVEMNGGWPGYRLSKTALNAVTRMVADELGQAGILVNSVCPGWVKTDMGGPGAERTLQEGADTVVWAATLPEGGPTGGFFRDREKIDW